MSVVNGLTIEEIDDGRAKVRLKISYKVATDDMESTVSILAGGNHKVHFSLEQKALRAGEQRVNVQFEERGEPVARQDLFTKDELPPVKYDFGESWYGWKEEEDAIHEIVQKVDKTEFHLDRKVYVKDEVRTIHPDTWGTDVGIAANADDGDDFAGTWHENGVSSNNWLLGHTDGHGGTRWSGITVSGTIDSCIIDVYSANNNAGGANGDIYAWDTADAGVFNDSNPPSGVSRTTASAPFDNILGGGWYNISGLQSIVQEIVDSYGLDDEAINFCWIIDGVSGDYAYVQDYSNAGTNEPELTITFTPAGGETINLSASISAASNTPNAIMNVARALSAAVAASTATPQCALNVARDLVANMQANSTTPDIVLANLIELVASIAVSTQSSVISLAVARNLVASHSAGTLTSDIALSIARDLAASISAATVTSAIELVIEGLINLAASINAISQTSQPQMAVARELSAQAQAQSSSSALILAVLRDLSGAIAVQSQTPEINLPVLRDITASIAGQTSTSDAALSIIRAISAQISAGTDTSAAVLAVLREIQTSMDAATLTSAINLITGGLGVITDAIIESLTTIRALESLTPNRGMDSLTIRRSIEQI